MRFVVMVLFLLVGCFGVKPYVASGQRFERWKGTSLSPPTLGLMKASQTSQTCEDRFLRICQRNSKQIENCSLRASKVCKMTHKN